ncbi:MAG: hypothetical protein P8170_11180 [Gemmatimonadota bacterium]
MKTQREGRTRLCATGAVVAVGGPGRWRLRFAAGLMAYFDRVGELGDPSEANELLGPPTTTLEEWIQHRAADQPTVSAGSSVG